MALRLIGGRDREIADRESEPDDAKPADTATDPARAPVLVVPRPEPRPVSPTNRPATTPSQTIIGPHLTLRGTMRGGDDIVIRGVLFGDIRGRRVEIRSGARVDGDIVAAEAIIGGAVRGNVEASQIDVRRGGGVEGRLENDGACQIAGEVQGDINSRDVAIKVGGQVNSNITADRARIAGNLTGMIEAGDVRIEETGRVVGQIECDGSIDILGLVDGQIRGRQVTIRDGATVSDAVQAEEIMIAGTAMGELTAVSVAIAATAHVDGRIIHHQIEIEQGAVVKGSRPWRPRQYLQQRDQPEDPDAPAD